jgi:hypothetical protein
MASALIEMASSGWIFYQLRSFIGSDDTHWLSLSITLSEQEISAKQFLAVNI